MNPLSKNVDENSPERYPVGAYFILGGYFLERFVYYGLFGGVVFYMQRVLQFSASTASTFKAVIEGIIYLAPIAGAILADTYFGKFRTVFLMCCIYTIGSLIFTLSSIPPLMLNVTSTQATGMIGIAVLGLSAGLMKAVYSSLGPDQFRIPQQKQQQEKFFYAFYWMINAGAFLGQILTAQVRSTVQCFGNDCYMLPFFILCTLMIISTTVFYSGKRWYRESPPDTTLIKSFNCLCYGIKKFFSKRNKPVPHWLDRTKEKFEVTLIEDVKKILRVLLLFVTFPFFWALFYQTSTGMIFQAKRLDDRVGSYRIPPEITSSINPLLILILIPMFEFVIYPFLNRKQILTSTTSRMITGMVLGTISFVIYGVINTSVEQDVLSKMETQLNIYNVRECNVSIYNTHFQNITNIPHGHEFKINSIRMVEESWDVSLLFRCGYFSENVRVLLKSEHETSVVVLKESILVLKPTKHYLKDRDAEAKVKIIDDSVKNIALDEIPKPMALTYRELVESFAFSDKTTEYRRVSPQNYTISHGNESMGYTDIRQDGVYLIVLSGKKGITFNMTPPSTSHMAWMFPQYLIITTGEILFSVSSGAFAYAEAPASMKSVMQAANLFTITIGLWMFAILTKIKSATGLFYYRASNEAFAYAVGMGINTVLFIVLVRYYNNVKSSTKEPDKKTYVSQENHAFECEAL